MPKFVAKYGVAFAFIMISLAGGFAINASAKKTARESATQAALVLYQSQLAACHRDNDLIRETNRRIRSDKVLKESILTFLAVAYKARLESFKTGGFDSDKKAANGYHKLIYDVEHAVHYRTVSIINCQKDVKKPK